MTRPVSVTQADLARTLKALADAGLMVAEVVIEDEKVRVLIGSPLATLVKLPNPEGPKQWHRKG